MRKLTIYVLFVVLCGCVFTQQPLDPATFDSIKPTEIILTDEISTNEELNTQPPQYDAASQNYTADSLIDNLIDLAVKHIQEKATGSLKLSDEVKELNRKFIGIPIKGELVLYNGQLSGINTVHRFGNSSYKIEHGLIDVNTTFIFDDLEYIYDFQANIYKLSTDGISRGNVTKLVTDIGLKINVVRKELELTRLKLISAKTLRIQIDSTKLKDKLFNYVLKTVTSIFKSAILSKMEKELQIYIGRELRFGA